MGISPSGLWYGPNPLDAQDPTFDARHRNQTGNVAWADGHVTTEKPVWYTTYNAAPSIDLLKSVRRRHRPQHLRCPR